MRSLRDLDIDEIAAFLKYTGQPVYRAEQIFKWAQSGVSDYNEMTNIPKTLRQTLFENFSLAPPSLIECRTASDGTRKYLWGFLDGNCVETVFMRYRHGNTVCVSTQAGCRMGCVFCASAKGGLVRNLTGAEILEQVLFTERDAGERVSNVVLMGTGEPLDNFENVLKFIALAGDPRGRNIGARHISLSTCGLVDKIHELEKMALQITLSISLHAPCDRLRREIMPVAKRWGVDELMATCRSYAAATGRRVSYEYALIRGFNDSADCAKELAGLLAGSLSHVNLIRLNEIRESDLKPSTAEDTQRFVKILNDRGVTATLRRRLGFDIDASCGQLRRRFELTGRGMDG